MNNKSHGYVKTMIEYIFKLNDNRVFNFKVDPYRDLLKTLEKQVLPEWTRLDYCQCRNCPLSPSERSYCPPAVDISDIAKKFSNVLSCDTVEVTVRTPAREYFKVCDIQTALKSLVGLVMATSKCPILSKLRPMAEFHLPFANPKETLFRAVGSFLIKQFFIVREGGEPDLELNGLKNLYQDLWTLNTDFTERMRALAVQDANPNAILELLMVVFSLNRFLENDLEEIKPLFI